MRMIFSNMRPKHGELQSAVRTLFSNHVGFGSYSGPAALLRGDGTVIVANGASAEIADCLGLGSDNGLHPTLAGAIRAGEFSTVAITLDASAGDDLAGVTFEFTVLPVIERESALVIGRDTALESAFRGALTESRQRYKELVDICGDFCWETDANGRFTFVSPGGALDYSADALVGRSPTDFFDPLLADAGESPFVTRQPVDCVDVWFRRADGEYACLETSSRPIAENTGQGGARGVCRDVTESRNRQDELSRVQIRERLIAHIMRTIRDEVVPEDMLRAAALATAQAVGAQGCRLYRDNGKDELVSAAEHGDGSPPDEVVAGAMARVKSDGRPFAVEQGEQSLLCVATSYQHVVNGALVLWRTADSEAWNTDERALAADVAVQLGVAIQQIRNQLELETLSRTDTLTGLLNRRAFTSELEARVGRADGPATGSLFYVDLDNFKPVNDILGHQKGDEALVAVSEMLVKSTRPGDLVARLGGDEFALWLDRTDDDAAGQRATDMLEGSSCLKPYSGDPARPLGVSIGVAVYDPGTSEHLESLMGRADTAMYEVKNNGKAGYIIAPGASDNGNQGQQAVSA